MSLFKNALSLGLICLTIFIILKFFKPYVQPFIDKFNNFYKTYLKPFTDPVTQIKKFIQYLKDQFNKYIGGMIKSFLPF